MERPRLLDLFSGAGGCGMGYHRAGFEVVGVDNRPQPRYPFEFHQADALQFLAEHGHEYDAIHASPPCQAHSCVTPRASRHRHPQMIGATQVALRQVGRLYVIENVPGARHLLRCPVMLCGSMFGLRCRRHRWFEVSVPGIVPPRLCDHSEAPLLVTTAGANSRANGNFKSISHAPLAYGIDWMGFEGLREAIPPAYTEYIGRQLLSSLHDG